MSTIQIRPATPADAAAISALLLSLAPAMTLDPAGRGAEAFLASLEGAPLARLLADPAFRYACAWDGEQLAGVVALRGPSHLYHLFVGASYQRRGLGHLLWEHARALVAPGLAITVNASAGAHAFYQGLGFADTAGRTEAQGIAYYPMLRQ